MKLRWAIAKINAVTGAVEGMVPGRYATERSAIVALAEQPTGAEYAVLPVYIKQAFRTVTPGAAVCEAEKTGATITDTSIFNFRIEWVNPVDFVATVVSYREQGTAEWLQPNGAGNATGAYDGTTAYALSGLTVGVTYEVRVQNQCANEITSAGVVVAATATDAM